MTGGVSVYSNVVTLLCITEIHKLKSNRMFSTMN